ncbi:LacI family DNA-binding transcriptional regulator [Tessaracoccus sp. Z1128]
MTEQGTPKRRKRVTIYDVAKEAGVAPSTVSRAFARPGRVNSETGLRIHEAAARLGYRVDPIARPDGLTRSTKLLAFVVADVTNPVYAHIMKGFQQEAAAHGHTVLLIDSQEDGQTENRLIHSVLHLVDGVALTSSRLSDSAITQIVKVTPVVAVNRTIAGLPSIIPDTARGMRRAVEHLATLGHRHLTYLSGPAASWADGARWRAVSEACHELSLHLRRIGPNAPSIHGGFAAGRTWQEHPTTGVIAFNDIMAIGFMKQVQGAGYRVPDDVSVIGVDNSISSVLTTPTLTTVSPSTSLIGARAARALITQLRHRSTPSAETIVTPMELLVRESVGPPPSKTLTAIHPTPKDK